MSYYADILNRYVAEVQREADSQMEALVSSPNERTAGKIAGLRQAISILDMIVKSAQGNERDKTNTNE